jgi:hypothetical protein
MKRFFAHFPFATALMMLTIALGLAAHGQQSAAQPSDEDRSATAPQNSDSTAAPPPQRNEAQMPASGDTTTQEAKSFSGVIVKENGELVLKDLVTKVIYKLNDAAKAKQYVGKRVKVTGKLDMNSNTIQVESIEVVT